MGRTGLMSKALAMLFMLLVTAGLVGQEAGSANQAASSVTPALQQQLDDLKTRMDKEHQRIQELQQQLLDREQGLQQLQQEMNGLRGNTADGSTPTNAPSSHSRNATAAAAGPSPFDPETPDALHFRGITLTPGGFFDMTGIYRTHNENADVDSTFGGIPLSGTANAELSEFRGSARASRFSLLAEGKINDWRASGYAEFDFEGAAPTANELESNSFNPRARQLWAQLQFNNGLSVAGGQTWSLLTTYRKGIELRQEMG